MRLEFEVADSDSDSGFEMGMLRVIGDAESYEFYCMVVLSATMLMGQAKEWSKKAIATLEFNPIDQSNLLIFSKKGADVTISILDRSGRRSMAHLKLHDLLREIFRSCEELREFVDRLPVDDAARHDFEVVASSFRTFMEAFGR